MVNTSMTHVFKHPKFYRIPRDKSDQTISDVAATARTERASGPGQTSKQQAPSGKPQALSTKPQAPSKSKTLKQES